MTRRLPAAAPRPAARARARVAALALAACLAAACSGAREAAAPAPELRYREAVAARVEVARAERVFTLRHNPTLCGCPPYEVLLDGVWQRVGFDVDGAEDPTLVALREATGPPGPGEALRTYVVQGRLSSALATCGRGALYVTLRPTAYGAPPAEPEPGPG